MVKYLSIEGKGGWMDKLDLNGIRQKLTRKTPFNKDLGLNALRKLLRGNFTCKSPKFIAGGLAIVIIGGWSLYYFNSTSKAYNVIIDDQRVGIVSSADEGNRIVHDFLVKIGEPIGQTAKIHNNIQYEPVRVKNIEYHELQEDDLKQNLNVFFEGAQLSINENIIATLGSQEVAESILNSIKKQYTVATATNKLESVNFEEKVEITPVQVPLNNVTSSTDVMEQLKKGKVSRQEYVVQSKMTPGG